MVLAIISEPMPLRVFDDGSTAEQIADDFDTLDLGNVHTVLGYYLHHKVEVDEYLAERQRYADEVRAKIEARQGSQDGLREKLLARLANNQC